MSAQRAKHLLTVSTVGVLMAGGAAVEAAGTASAAAPAHLSSAPPQSSRGCDEVWGNDGCETHDEDGEFVRVASAAGTDPGR